MRINFFSDIHLEFGDQELPETDAQVIIAAGDIGIYTQGVEWLARADVPVLYVAGNHEFFQHEYFDADRRIREKTEGTAVHFLNNSRVDIDGVRFLGTTLWTGLGEHDGIDPVSLREVLNDFRKIRYLDEFLSEQDYLRLHREARHWLQNELAQPFDGKTVVISHHAPTCWSWNGSSQALLRYAYCNDLRELMHRYEIDLWVHGHTHNALDYRCSGTRIVCNPRGYAGRQLVKGFEQNKVLEI